MTLAGLTYEYVQQASVFVSFHYDAVMSKSPSFGASFMFSFVPAES